MHMLDLPHHPRVELVMYLSQIDHLDHAMTQTMANRPRTEAYFTSDFTFICVVDSDKTKSDNAGHLLIVNNLFYFLFSC